MPASYPNSVKVFTTKTTGQTILASHINEPQDEITAIEQGLLQGLAHAIFPSTDVGQDLGTTTKRWRQLLVQKIAAGVTNATRLRVQEVGTSTWITVNADFDGTNWNREDTTKPAQGIEINNNKEVKYYRAAAGTNPITWTNVFTISTDRITASQAVIGTDPGGTEVLRAQNLRAGATTLTSTLTAPTVVVGTDPGGTEALRAQNLRAGATTLTGTLTAPTVVVGTDPGGTEKLRAENLRAGSTTITAGLSVPSSLPTYGSDSSVAYGLSETTYADRVAWTSAALHNIFASATNIVVETSDDGTTWTTGNADDFRRIVRRAPSIAAFTSQYVRFTFDVGMGNIVRHIIANFGVQTNLTRVLRVERSGDGGNTWTTVLNDVTFSGAEQTRVFATSATVNSKVRITLWATTWSAGNTHALSWLCGTTYYPFRSDAWRAPRLGQPDGSTRTALMSNTDVVPLADSTHDVGTSSLRWRSIYGVSGVFGTDPGGTESLRAGSARLNAPVLLGSVPQFTMANDPTAALQVATKQYADTKLARDTAETITARHTFNPSTTGAPFLVGTNASGQLVTGLNADQVDGQHLADLDARFVNASGDSMTGNLTAPTAVIGTDPGGTEVLRAQNLRAGAATLTGALTSPTVVAGTDPGGTEALRAGSARLNAPVLLGSVPQFTMAGDPTSDLQVATKQYADTKVSKTTSETITARHTFNPSTAGAPFLLGANASGQLVTGLNADQVDGQHLADLDTRFVNAAGDTMTGPLVLSGDPTAPEHAATKAYVDNRFPRLINDVTLSASATTVTIDLAETVGTTTPLLIVGECRFNGVNSSQVFMVVNGDASGNYFSSWYGVGVTNGSEGPTNAARVVPRSDSIRSSFWLLWMPVTTANRAMVAGQWTSGGPSGGGVHPQWAGSTAPYSFTFLVDAGSFAAGTRFLVFRLGA
jgi:hypothetical protein